MVNFSEFIPILGGIFLILVGGALIKKFPDTRTPKNTNTGGKKTKRYKK
jgi:hypothetical protein